MVEQRRSKAQDRLLKTLDASIMRGLADAEAGRKEIHCGGSRHAEASKTSDHPIGPLKTKNAPSAMKAKPMAWFQVRASLR